MVFHEFAKKVAQAMNICNVRPDTQGEFLQSVLVVVGKEDKAPYGGSLNYDDKTDTWVVDAQIDEGEQVNG